MLDITLGDHKRNTWIQHPNILMRITLRDQRRNTLSRREYMYGLDIASIRKCVYFGLAHALQSTSVFKMQTEFMW